MQGRDKLGTFKGQKEVSGVEQVGEGREAGEEMGRVGARSLRFCPPAEGVWVSFQVSSWAGTAGRG